MELLKDTSINENSRVNLFITMIKEFTSDECKQCFQLLKMPEFVKIFEHKERPIIPINSSNRKILDALKDAGFIDNFIEDEDEKIYKQIRRRISRVKLPNELL